MSRDGRGLLKIEVLKIEETTGLKDFGE